jgi:DNA-directed RNA polymerase specialized sigma24 family protein
MPASPSGSVTAWIVQLKNGEEAALANVHRRYWPVLVALARERLHGAGRNAADEEDVAQEAFWGFYSSLKAGRLPRLETRHDLFAVLGHIVACKAVNQIQHENGVVRRGAGWARQMATFKDQADDSAPTPLEEALLRDCYRYYLERLPERLRDFAQLYLAGCTHQEISARLGCVKRTSERKIAIILELWRDIAAQACAEEWKKRRS